MLYNNIYSAVYLNSGLQFILQSDTSESWIGNNTRKRLANQLSQGHKKTHELLLDGVMQW